MNRRRFLQDLSFGAASLSRIGAAAAQPNVLLICVDDLRPQLGCYGYSQMVTPHIGRFTAGARRFNRHYVQSAVCGPSRCSMLTGKRLDTWDCWGERRKRTSEPDEPVSVAHLFRRNGYRTVCIGKVSHQPGGVMDPEQRIHQVPFSWDKSFAPVGPWRTPWRAFFAYDNAKAYNAVIKMEKDEPRLPYEIADVADTGYADGLNAEAAVGELVELSKRGRPFFLAVGFYKPHLPFNAPRKYWDLYPAEKVALAANLHPPGEGNISDEDARILRRADFACVSRPAGFSPGLSGGATPFWPAHLFKRLRRSF